MSEIKGICPKCGARYFGWVIADPAKQKCERCGGDLEILENRVRIRSSYSSSMTWTYRMVSNPKKKYGGGGTVIN